MPDRVLPDRPNLEQYKKQAKELLRTSAASEPAALARLRKHHPRLRDLASASPRAITLADAQFVLAREHGYGSWSAFAKHIEALRIIRSLEELDDPLNTFIEVACVDRHGWHRSGTVEHADMILARYPQVATGSIYSAAVLADEAAVRAWLARDPSLATAAGGPRQWDALTYLCFSRYLRMDRARSDAFVSTARALLEAGANANTGWTEYIDDPPRPVHEAAIYGAAGLAQNPGLTQLLLDYGADPNDEETPYHVPETYDNTVLEILLRSGRFNKSSLVTVALRKCDWHDDKGLELALQHGADPNDFGRWNSSFFHHAIRRDNGLVMIDAILDRNADPYLPNHADGRSAIQMAAYHGRGDILSALERRGFELRLEGLDALVASCARADVETAHSLASAHPQLLAELLSIGGSLLARFAGAEDDGGVRCLLALGVPAAALWPEGDPYWELTPNSTALHVAAWRAHHEVVRTLIAAGTPVNALDARNRSALQLAVRACTDSYWKYRRQSDSVVALLAAGALTVGIVLPTGYDAIDDLLRVQNEPGSEDRSSPFER
ncbi:MAG: ankyrin repeat domain-containing protein [Terracidiphilus sp.]|jgi:ankyrin repeat protein